MTVNIEDAKTSEDEGSLASIRERVKQERVFSGHPADLAGPIGDDEEEEPEGKHVQPPESETPTPEGGGPEDGIPDKKGEEGPGSEFKPKYKNQEEAERAQREAERKMHEATTRAADLERENAELRSKQTQPPTQETPPAPTPEELETQVSEVLNEIDNLDPYADDYQAQRAKLWTKVATLRGGTPVPDESKVTEIVRRTLDEDRQARRAQDEETRSRQAAVKMAKEAGLNMDDPDSHDALLFWKALDEAPMGEGVTLRRQVDFMISRVKAKKGQAAAARSETAPETEILGRGGTPPPAKSGEDFKPRTLNSIRESLREKRRI
jgi:hypothetical protein